MVLASAAAELAAVVVLQSLSFPVRKGAAAGVPAVQKLLKRDCIIGPIPHLQALLFVRWIRGDMDAYPPFLWKG